MSFPNVPDINPTINITLEDAVNLLLMSIALEEVSLSKLMDAEACKILCVLNDCKHSKCDLCDCTHEKCVLHDALLINQSVDDTMKNMIKMQMLLQFKLEKVKEIIPSTSTTTTTSTSTTTTTTCTRTTTTKCTSSTTSCTTSSSTSTCSTSTKRPCRCSLTGKGTGCIANLYHEFDGQPVVLSAFVSCRDAKSGTICYSVGGANPCLDFCVPEGNVKIECPCKYPDAIILYGKGRVEKKSRCSNAVIDTAKFRLTVYKANTNQLEFKMEITADTKPEFNHNSGVVPVKNCASTLVLEICC